MNIARLRLPVRLAFAALVTLAAGSAQAQSGGSSSAAPVCPALLQHTFARLQDEKPQSLCAYAGKVVLVVNTASYCGFTSQFEGLEALSARYAGQGLVVMGFPSNDFKQEDAERSKTADVCFNTYGVRFPMFTPVSVRGRDAHPLFAALAKHSGQAPAWNFNKYLIGRDGNVVAHFGSTTAPGSRTLVSAVEAALARRGP